MLQRINGRQVNQLREVKITRNYTKYAEGAVFIESGETKVLCTATIEETVPLFLKGSSSGWVTAEYAMLPRSTHTRNKRDGVAGKVNSRAQEISRLIGRSLRACIDLNSLGERQILIDCDVIQADGGTRTASITGAFIALYDAVNGLVNRGILPHLPIERFLAAISVGVVNGVAALDLDYSEDSNCDTDLNLVMFDGGGIIEIQGTAEKHPLSREQINELLDLGYLGITELIRKQKLALDIG